MGRESASRHSVGGYRVSLIRVAAPHRLISRPGHYQTHIAGRHMESDLHN